MLGLLPAVALVAACGMLVRERWRTQTAFDWLPCYLFGGFALTYFTGLMVSLVVGATNHGMQPRFLAPLYVPLLGTAAFAFDRVLGFAPWRCRFWKPGWRRRAGSAAAAVATAVLYVYVNRLYYDYGRDTLRAAPALAPVAELAEARFFKSGVPMRRDPQTDRPDGRPAGWL